jgi:hypothetical protein
MVNPNAWADSAFGVRASTLRGNPASTFGKFDTRASKSGAAPTIDSTKSNSQYTAFSTQKFFPKEVSNGLTVVCNWARGSVG